mmetsp:Transcript_19244/g.73639  ORF Transcript_19244/g.73639 Transcript_19244/m.73639 type:complete len:230 (-) Transcript_19244:3493-4182(-)
MTNSQRLEAADEDFFMASGLKPASTASSAVYFSMRRTVSSSMPCTPSPSSGGLANSRSSATNEVGLFIIFLARFQLRFLSFSLYTMISTALVTSATAGGGLGRALSVLMASLSRLSTALAAAIMAGSAAASSVSALPLIFSAEAFSSAARAAMAWALASSTLALACSSSTCLSSSCVLATCSATFSIVCSRSFLSSSTSSEVFCSVERPSASRLMFFPESSRFSCSRCE